MVLLDCEETGNVAFSIFGDSIATVSREICRKYLQITWFSTHTAQAARYTTSQSLLDRLARGHSGSHQHDVGPR